MIENWIKTSFLLAQTWFTFMPFIRMPPQNIYFSEVGVVLPLLLAVFWWEPRLKLFQTVWRAQGWKTDILSLCLLAVLLQLGRVDVCRMLSYPFHRTRWQTLAPRTVFLILCLYSTVTCLISQWWRQVMNYIRTFMDNDDSRNIDSTVSLTCDLSGWPRQTRSIIISFFFFFFHRSKSNSVKWVLK